MSDRFHKPVLQPSDDFDWLAGSDEPGAAHQLAHETSWALLDRVHRVANPEVVERVATLAARNGVDDIAELWARAGAHSLAGMLWRLYLLQRAVRVDPAGTADLFRLGTEATVTIDVIVAGAAEPITPSAISRLCETILRGVFTGDPADAFERASSYCRVMSTGAAELADRRDGIDDEHAEALTRRSLRYHAFAEDLSAGAARWRQGILD